jgi:hypothetical protein
MKAGLKNDLNNLALKWFNGNYLVKPSSRAMINFAQINPTPTEIEHFFNNITFQKQIEKLW